MKTRILALTLALLFVVQLAYATVPSVTTADLYTAEVTKLDGTPVANVGAAIDPMTPTSIEVLNDITAATAGGQSITSGYFAGQQVAIRNVLPAGTDLNALQLKELASLTVPGYTQDMGDLKLTLSFPTTFDMFKPVVVLVGLVVGDVIIWQVVPAVVNVDGSITIDMPAALLLQVQAGNAVISILQ